jgi:DNA-binding NarL/FixJ family response regulator
MSKVIELPRGPVMRVPTKRERQIAQLIVRGLSNGEIAHSMGLATKTVEAHRANMYRKLGVKNTAQFVQVALTSGLAKMKGVSVA